MFQREIMNWKENETLKEMLYFTREFIPHKKNWVGLLSMLTIDPFLVFKVFKLIAAYTSHSITGWCNIGQNCSGDCTQNSFLPIIPSVCPPIIGQVVRAGLSISTESCAGLWFDSNGGGEFHYSRLTSEMESLSNVNVSSPTWLMNWRRSFDELRISRNW